MIAIPAQKTYTGRLAFDPDTGFHLAEDGKQVVTEDGGASWRYATEDDMSHLDRYERRVLVIDTTANQLGELALKHGEEQAKLLVEPHHFETQPGDLHYDASADNPKNPYARPQSDPDHIAATITSHTAAYEGASDE